MRRLLAFMLALLLPVCAMAEPHGLSVVFEADEALLNSYVRQWLALGADTLPENLDLYVQLAQRVLNGASMRTASQEDAVYVEVNLSGGKLLDMTIHAVDDASCMTSSMLGNNALVEKADSTEQDDSIAEINWAALGSSIEQTVETWFAAMEPTTVRGAFAGDAYEGGTQCITWSFTDMDIAALASAIMTEDVRKAAAAVMSAYGLDSEDLLARFDELNAKVADEDVYLYILRVVKNDADEIIGASLTVVEEITQVATISLGFEGEGVRLVAGFGLNQQNYWWEFTMLNSETETMFSGKSREWVAEKEKSFAYVCEKEMPVTNFDWYFRAAQTGECHEWDGAIYEELADSERKNLFSMNGNLSADDSVLSSSFSLGGGQERALTMSVDYGPAEKIPEIAEGLTYYDLSDPNSAEMGEKLMQQFVAAISAKLIKLLPMDLILQLSMPQLP